MSEDLVNKFIETINEDDGLSVKTKKKRTAIDKKREIVQQVLHAAARGQVSLPEEEQFLVEKRKKRKGNQPDSLNDRWASQGFSLVDQIRSEKPKDLLRRNVKYMKFTEKRKIDGKKSATMLLSHMKSLPNKNVVRRDREKIDCLRAPKKESNKKTSVFSAKDFAAVKKAPLKLKKIQDEDGAFI